jgi:predicted short-subunit dehydrogenase-like oxidoreductase (DUF2520 family)
MGQVPTQIRASNKTYLLIGRGRLAQHLTHWFQANSAFKTEQQSSQSASLYHWDRSQSLSHLQMILEEGGVHLTVLLAISDDAIVNFYQNHLLQFKGHVVHFSGVLDQAPLLCAHPLMSFPSELYEKDFYSTIPFAITGFKNLQEVFPFLVNESVSIPPEQKPLYHAMAVMSGNFMTLLLQKIFKLSLHELKISPEFFAPFLKKTLENTLQKPEGALTGPLVRGDFKTIEKHLKALDGLGSASSVRGEAQELLKIYNTYMNIELAKVRK